MRTCSLQPAQPQRSSVCWWSLTPPSHPCPSPTACLALGYGAVVLFCLSLPSPTASIFGSGAPCAARTFLPPFSKAGGRAVTLLSLAKIIKYETSAKRGDDFLKPSGMLKTHDNRRRALPCAIFLKPYARFCRGLCYASWLSDAGSVVADCFFSVLVFGMAKRWRLPSSCFSWYSFLSGSASGSS